MRVRRDCFGAVMLLGPWGIGCASGEDVAVGPRHNDVAACQFVDSGEGHRLLKGVPELVTIKRKLLSERPVESAANQVAKVLSLPLDQTQQRDSVGHPGEPDSVPADEELVRVGTSSVSAYGGMTSRRSTLLQNLLDQGMDGRTGNRLNGEDPVRIGIFEGSMLNYEHVGWRSCAASSCPSRLRARKDCSEFPCVDSTAPPASEGPHATVVSYIAAGSIEEGQDPSFPGVHTPEQIARSGHLPGSHVYFYTGGDSDAIANAIYQSVLDGVDVLNLSLRWGPKCDATHDVSGINLALKTARKHGVLVTACAGNSGPKGCTVWYPAVRTDTLSVNGLRTRDAQVDYGNTSLNSHASRGDVPIRVVTGWEGKSSAIDLSAPGTLHLFAAHEGTTGYAADNTCGCSVATPVVSAAAGAMKGVLHAMGQPTNCAGLLMVNMLLMGDGWDPATGERRSGLSSLSGAGRLRMHWYGDLVQPAGWNMHAFRIHEGETHAFSVGDAGPESSSIQQWKWAALWFEDDLRNVADVDFFVYDTCPPGGGEELVTSNIGLGLRARFTLFQPDIRGRCLEARVVGTAVPAEGREIWMADYFHSGDPATH